MSTSEKTSKLAAARQRLRDSRSPSRNRTQGDGDGDDSNNNNDDDERSDNPTPLLQLQSSTSTGSASGNTPTGGRSKLEQMREKRANLSKLESFNSANNENNGNDDSDSDNGFFDNDDGSNLLNTNNKNKNNSNNSVNKNKNKNRNANINAETFLSDSSNALMITFPPLQIFPGNGGFVGTGQEVVWREGLVDGDGGGGSYGGTVRPVGWGFGFGGDWFGGGGGGDSGGGVGGWVRSIFGGKTTNGNGSTNSSSSNNNNNENSNDYDYENSGLYKPATTKKHEQILNQNRLTSRITRDCLQADIEIKNREVYGRLRDDVIGSSGDGVSFGNGGGDGVNGEVTPASTQLKQSQSQSQSTAGTTFNAPRGPSSTASYFTSSTTTQSQSSSNNSSQLQLRPPSYACEVKAGNYRPYLANPDTAGFNANDTNDRSSSSGGRNINGSGRNGRDGDINNIKNKSYLKTRVNKVVSGVENSSHSDSSSSSHNNSINNSSSSSSSGGKLANLTITIPKLSIYDHPLLNHEEVLYVKIKMVYGKYQGLFEVDGDGREGFLWRGLEGVLGSIFSGDGDGDEGVGLNEYLFGDDDDLDKENRDNNNGNNGNSDEDNEDRNTKITSLTTTLTAQISSLLEVHHTRQTLEKELYDTWTEIKRARLKQGFTCTPAMLTARVVDVDSVDSENGNNGNGSRGLKGRLEGINKKDKGKSGKVKSKSISVIIEEVKRVFERVHELGLLCLDSSSSSLSSTTANCGTSGGASTTDSQSTKPVSTKESQTKLHLLLSACTALQPQTQPSESQSDSTQTEPTPTPTYILRLTNTSQYTPTPSLQKNTAEKTRRNSITNESYYIILNINGKKVACTQSVILTWPGFTCTFNKRYRCRVHRRPTSISLLIMKSGTFLNADSKISEVNVAVPGDDKKYDGVSVESIGGNVGWYQFAKSDTYSWDNSNASTSASSGGINKGLRRCTGGVMVGAEWSFDGDHHGSHHGSHHHGGNSSDGYDSDNATDTTKLLGNNSSSNRSLGPLLPPRPISQTTNRLQGLKPSDLSHLKHDTDHITPPPSFAQERDFISMLPGISSIDPNDPRNFKMLRLNDILLPSQAENDVFRTHEREYALAFTVPFTNTVYSNAYKLEQPRRMQLLKLRHFKPALFFGSIPLEEEVIKKDDNYRTILSKERQNHEDAENGFNVRERERTSNKRGGGKMMRRAVDVNNIKDFVKRIAAAKSNNSMSIRRKRQTHFSSVVQEGVLPRFVKLDFDFKSLLEFFVPPRRRGLRPNVKERVAVSALVRRCRLLVTVVGARNVPWRVDGNAADNNNAGGNNANNGNTSPERQRRLRSPSPSATDSNHNNTSQQQPDPTYTTDAFNSVHTFVEITFQSSTTSTRCVSGPSPLWKQTLDLPFRPPMGDFSPAHLSMVRDNVEVMLFDSVSVMKSKEGGGVYDDEDVNATHTERRYLGALTIPFSTIYKEGKVEGTYRLDSPVVCLGYTKRGVPVVEPGSNEALVFDEGRGSVGDGDNGDGDGDGNGKDGFKPSGPTTASLTRASETSTYVKIIATLDPLLLAPPDDHEQSSSMTVTSKESPLLLHHARRLLESTSIRSSKMNEKRNYQLLAPDMTGSTWLLSRYLHPQRPPTSCDTVMKCAHYVAMVPFLDDWRAFEGGNGNDNSGGSSDNGGYTRGYEMWLTSANFLSILAGSWSEHAVLLANYFLSLSATHPTTMLASEVYLVLGTGIPEGDTVYVCRVCGLTGEVVFWNACSGRAYAKSDERCPLYSVGTLVSRDNVYFNVQRSGKTCDINMDVNDGKCWKPFYSPRFPKPSTPLPTVQETRLSYITPNVLFAEELQDELTNTLKRDVRRWRRGPTSFKGDTANRLRLLLESLEASARGGNTSASSSSSTTTTRAEHNKRLSQTIRNRDTYGIPLNFPFTDVDDIVAKVKATGVHLCRGGDAEFAVAVRCFAYEGGVVSVWVYFCAMTPK